MKPINKDIINAKLNNREANENIYMNVTFNEWIHADSCFCHHGACRVCIDWDFYLLLYVFFFCQFQWFMCEEPLRFFMLIINNKGDNNW